MYNHTLIKCGLQTLAVLVLAGWVMNLQADAPRYTFVSLDSYKYSSSIEGIEVDPDGRGVSLQLSYAVRPYIVVTAGYRAGNAEAIASGANIKADTQSTSYGLLAHLPITGKTDLVLAVDFLNGVFDVKKNGVYYTTVDVDGGRTSLGVRSMVFNELELNVFLHKNSIEDVSRVGTSFGAAYFVSESVSFDIDYFIDSDNDFLAFGMSRYF